MPHRCAIYTRVSVARSGTDDLTSCDVQRQLCEEFVKSRAPDGWAMLPERFDVLGEMPRRPCHVGEGRREWMPS